MDLDSSIDAMGFAEEAAAFLAPEFRLAAAAWYFK